MSDQEIYKLLIYIPIGLMTIGVVSGLVRYTSIGKSQRLVLFLMVAALLAEGCAGVLRKVGPTSYPVFHVYALIEYVLLILIYAHFTRKRESKALLWTLPVMVLIGVVNVLLFQGWHELNTNVTTVSSTIFIILAAVLFFRMLSEMRYVRIEKSSLFWINNGVIIYFSTSLLLFIFSATVVEISVEQSLSVWMIHLFVNIVHYLCFNIALWMDPE